MLCRLCVRRDNGWAFSYLSSRRYTRLDKKLVVLPSRYKTQATLACCTPRDPSSKHIYIYMKHLVCQSYTFSFISFTLSFLFPGNRAHRKVVHCLVNMIYVFWTRRLLHEWLNTKLLDSEKPYLNLSSHGLNFIHLFIKLITAGTSQHRYIVPVLRGSCPRLFFFNSSNSKVFSRCTLAGFYIHQFPFNNKFAFSISPFS